MGREFIDSLGKYRIIGSGIAETYYINALLRESLGCEGTYEHLEEDLDHDQQHQWLTRCVINNPKYLREVDEIWKFSSTKDVQKLVTSELYRKAEEL